MSRSDDNAVPSHERPMLVGLAIDVSGSMARAIRNPSGPRLNRFEAFRDAFRKLAERGKELTRRNERGETESLVRLFIYGFGFGNPLSVILGRSGPPVRDLLNIDGRGSAPASIDGIADDWDRYEAHLMDLAVEMFGGTQMDLALEIVGRRFENELERGDYHRTPLLFLLSDGMPNRGTAEQVRDRAEELKASGVLLVSCFITDQDIAEPRRLYAQTPVGWPEGARLMFECSSELPSDSEFADYLADQHWTIEPAGRLFAQVNQSDLLAEFLNLVLSPMHRDRAEVAAGPGPLKVFFSYAHEDRTSRDRLEKHLSLLRRERVITTWHDRMITAGREWRGEIDERMRSADIVLLLVSEHFLASDYCYDVELSCALSRHEEGSARVIPVILRPVDWERAPFGKLQALPAEGRPVTNWRSSADAFADVAKGIRQAAEEIIGG